MIAVAPQLNCLWKSVRSTFGCERYDISRRSTCHRSVGQCECASIGKLLSNQERCVPAHSRAVLPRRTSAAACEPQAPIANDPAVPDLTRTLVRSTGSVHYGSPERLETEPGGHDSWRVRRWSLGYSAGVSLRPERS